MNDKWEIIHGDALKVLREFAPNTFDAVITDPPYASGGRTQAEKNKSTDKKYSSMGESAPPPFDGDSKDQRSWTRWAAEWLYDARKVCKPGAPVCMFIDWRQLPAATDALQWAGWIWRGTAVWDKGNSRPQKGRFRQQAEYIVWGSNGDMPISRPVPCLPGVFKYGNPQNRIHLTEKPLQLMRDVVKITEPGGRILDPFAGSGSTVLAAVLPFAVIFLPALMLGDINTLLSNILGLLPDKLLQINRDLAYFDLYQLGDSVMGAIPILLVLYTVLTLLFIPLLYKTYQHKQLK